MIEPASPSPPPSSESRESSIAGGGSHSKRRRYIVAAILLLLVLIFVPPFINISRFRHNILNSISAGLGRPVEATSVELELFPRPGFVLHNLTVGEDPAFGAEPVMMAQTVTATLRASALWHARVEIASLRFEAPSVNLVRDPDGHWNFESLLHASPALLRRGSSASNGPLPFPYVEATEARINFKQGAEKLPFSLERANLAVWKESAHKWRLRIKALPVRTDLTGMDAGQVRGEGTLMTRGGDLLNAGIRGRLQWRRVQLGEIGRLLQGEDNGWRGTVDWTARVLGTLTDGKIDSDIAVDDFHRAEFFPATTMDLSAHCQARYVRTDRHLDSLVCDAPVGGGHLRLRESGGFPDPATALAGNLLPHRNLLHGIGPLPERAGTPRLQIGLQKIRADFFLDLLRHIHPGVAEDAAVSGTVNGAADCDWRRIEVPKDCTGAIQAEDLRLRLAHFDRPLALSPFLLASSLPADRRPAVAPASGVWELSPIHVPLGRSAPATITGSMTWAGSSLQIAGPVGLSDLNKLAQALRISALSGAVQSMRGDGLLALSFESTWLPQLETNVPPVESAQPTSSSLSTGFVPSRWTGSLQIHNATLKLAALPRSIRLATAQVDLTPTGVQWGGLQGAFAQIPFDGSIAWQTPCATAQSACGRTFALHTSHLSADSLQALLRNPSGGNDLLNLINAWAGGAPSLPEMSGTLDADVLSVGPVALKDALLRLHLEGHRAELLAVSGQVFGGTVSGAVGTKSPAPDSPGPGVGWVQWGDGAPRYALRATLQHIEPDRAAAIWRERWGGGTADLGIDLKTQGWSAADLARNASGKFAFTWLNGAFSPADGSRLPTAAAFEKFKRWDAEGVIRNSNLVFGSSRFVPQKTVQHGGRRAQISVKPQTVTGTISFARAVHLRFQPSGISIAGPLDAPSGDAAPAARHPAVKAQMQ